MKQWNNSNRSIESPFESYWNRRQSALKDNPVDALPNSSVNSDIQLNQEINQTIVNKQPVLPKIRTERVKFGPPPSDRSSETEISDNISSSSLLSLVESRTKNGYYVYKRATSKWHNFKYKQFDDKTIDGRDYFHRPKLVSNMRPVKKLPKKLEPINGQTIFDVSKYIATCEGQAYVARYSDRHYACHGLPKLPPLYINSRQPRAHVDGHISACQTTTNGYMKSGQNMIDEYTSSSQSKSDGQPKPGSEMCCKDCGLRFSHASYFGFENFWPNTTKKLMCRCELDRQAGFIPHHDLPFYDAMKKPVPAITREPNKKKESHPLLVTRGTIPHFANFVSTASCYSKSGQKLFEGTCKARKDWKSMDRQAVRDKMKKKTYLLKKPATLFAEPLYRIDKQLIADVKSNHPKLSSALAVWTAYHGSEKPTEDDLQKDELYAAYNRRVTFADENYSSGETTVDPPGYDHGIDATDASQFPDSHHFGEESIDSEVDNGFRFINVQDVPISVYEVLKEFMKTYKRLEAPSTDSLNDLVLQQAHETVVYEMEKMKKVLLDSSEKAQLQQLKQFIKSWRIEQTLISGVSDINLVEIDETVESIAEEVLKEILVFWRQQMLESIKDIPLSSDDYSDKLAQAQEAVLIEMNELKKVLLEHSEEEQVQQFKKFIKAWHIKQMFKSGVIEVNLSEVDLVVGKIPAEDLKELLNFWKPGHPVEEHVDTKGSDRSVILVQEAYDTVLNEMKNLKTALLENSEDLFANTEQLKKFLKSWRKKQALLSEETGENFSDIDDLVDRLDEQQLQKILTFYKQEINVKANNVYASSTNPHVVRIAEAHSSLLEEMRKLKKFLFERSEKDQIEQMRKVIKWREIEQMLKNGVQEVTFSETELVVAQIEEEEIKELLRFYKEGLLGIDNINGVHAETLHEVRAHQLTSDKAHVSKKDKKAVSGGRKDTTGIGEIRTKQLFKMTTTEDNDVLVPVTKAELDIDDLSTFLYAIHVGPMLHLKRQNTNALKNNVEKKSIKKKITKYDSKKFSEENIAEQNITEKAKKDHIDVKSIEAESIMGQKVGTTLVRRKTFGAGKMKGSNLEKNREEKKEKPAGRMYVGNTDLENFLSQIKIIGAEITDDETDAFLDENRAIKRTPMSFVGYENNENVDKSENLDDEESVESYVKLDEVVKKDSDVGSEEKEETEIIQDNSENSIEEERFERVESKSEIDSVDEEEVNFSGHSESDNNSIDDLELNPSGNKAEDESKTEIRDGLDIDWTKFVQNKYITESGEEITEEEAKNEFGGVYNPLKVSKFYHKWSSVFTEPVGYGGKADEPFNQWFEFVDTMFLSSQLEPENDSIDDPLLEIFYTPIQSQSKLASTEQGTGYLNKGKQYKRAKSILERKQRLAKESYNINMGLFSDDRGYKVSQSTKLQDKGVSDQGKMPLSRKLTRRQTLPARLEKNSGKRRITKTSLKQEASESSSSSETTSDSLVKGQSRTSKKSQNITTRNKIQHHRRATSVKDQQDKKRKSKLKDIVRKTIHAGIRQYVRRRETIADTMEESEGVKYEEENEVTENGGEMEENNDEVKYEEDGASGGDKTAKRERKRRTLPKKETQQSQTASERRARNQYQKKELIYSPISPVNTPVEIIVSSEESSREVLATSSKPLSEESSQGLDVYSSEEEYVFAGYKRKLGRQPSLKLGATRTLNRGTILIRLAELTRSQEEAAVQDPTTERVIYDYRPSARTCRFGLPENLTLLNSMSPTQYLSDYVDLQPQAKILFGRVFYKYSQKYRMNLEQLTAGIKAVLTPYVTSDDISELFKMVNLSDHSVIDRHLFYGCTALTERLIFPKYVALGSLVKPQATRLELEQCDFDILKARATRLFLRSDMLRVLEVVMLGDRLKNANVRRSFRDYTVSQYLGLSEENKSA